MSEGMSTAFNSKNHERKCDDTENVLRGQYKEENKPPVPNESADASKSSVKPYVIKQRRLQTPYGETNISKITDCEKEYSPLSKTTDTDWLGEVVHKKQTCKTSWRERDGHTVIFPSTEIPENTRAKGLKSKSYRPYKSNSHSWSASTQKRSPSCQSNWREKSSTLIDAFQDDGDDLTDISGKDLLFTSMLPDNENIHIFKGNNSNDMHIGRFQEYPVMEGIIDSDLNKPQNTKKVKRYFSKTTLRKPVTFKELKHRDPEFALTELTKSEITLKQYISRSHEDNNFLEEFLEILANAFVCEAVPHAMIMLFENLKEHKFFDALALFFLDIQDHIEDEANTVKCEKVVKDVLQIAVSQTSRNPSSVTVFTRVHKIMGQIINDLQGLDDFLLSEEIQTNFDFLSKRKKEAEQILKSSKEKGSIQPPEDFRQIQVIPDMNEIKGGLKPFLRPNKTEGKYNDLDHYLDVQFRLLREDFVGPLREGISEYIKAKYINRNWNNSQKTKGDLKFYSAIVHSQTLTEHGYCLQMKLELKKGHRKINWSVSKRLIYGSLLCLTQDDFETMAFATVTGREDQDMRQGLFTVHLDSSMKTYDLLHRRFKIAETSAYFESYKHVLNGLQKIRTGDMPFEQYIVHCESKVDKPAYLTSESTYDLQPLVDQNMVIVAEKKLPVVDVTTTDQLIDTSSEIIECVNKVNILDTKNWPAKDLFNLDESQYEAVKTALTKEFSIIQGPPGTGKTYIGLQITRALLHNRDQWNETMLSNGQKYNSPMLIVCFTNHALDQFLEGVHTFFKGSILRVGGRSKSSVLERYNLRAFRHSCSHHGEVLSEIKSRRSEAKLELDFNSKEISRCANLLDLYQNVILHENALINVMNRRFYNSLKHEEQRRKMRNCNTSMITEWLGITTTIADVKRKVKYNGSAAQSEQKFVRLDDEPTERRLCGRRQKSSEGTKLFEKTKEQNIAYFVEDTVIPDKANKEEKQRLEVEREFKALLKSTIHEKLNSPDIMNHEESMRISNIWHLSTNDRWRLYRMWLRELCRNMYNEIDSKRVLYESASERYHDILMEEDKEIMRNASVIGMTTTCAAKYQSVLREIGPKIIIVEEAAEVLEAHIITTLSKSCQHVILIGDHKQLRPNPNVYRLAVRYNLNISLFERMIENGIKFSSLLLQHRMRPEIAGIMRHIYPTLEDHDNVKNYPTMKGVSTNLFFIHHEKMEEHINELKSYSNIHEALFAVGLCRYLLLQGYGKDQITVLTTYTGQLLCIRNAMPFEEFEGVRVTVVDNYQGEENDIVILSLVRSNNGSKVGFLKADNRICVALSRAKIAFYVIGNFKQYAENSSLWKTITDHMQIQGNLGDGLKLTCQNHPTDKAIVAKEGKDFRKAPNGGCSKKCVVRLQCGHVCQQFCHVSDTNHLIYKCRKPCQRVICEKHKCPDDCYKKCRPCQVLVAKVIPVCGHEQKVKCYLDPKEYVCQMPCLVELPCGHQCSEVCGAPHTKECSVTVKRLLTCGHEVETQCFQKTDEVDCPSPCKVLLKCEHHCGGTCGQCSKGRMHVACRNECKRILVCGHECSAFCNNCPPCKQKCENRCGHSLCQNKCGELCVQCQEPCEWRCEHFKCTKLCSEPCDRPRCNEPCHKLLPCRHMCMGLCGERCDESFCKECNFKEVTEILFGNEDDEKARFVYLEDCGHNIESTAMDTYMDMKDEMEAVQLKGCPKCKTPIRSCLRYGTAIKESLWQIERVKKAVKEKSDVDNLKVTLCNVLKSNQEYMEIERNRLYFQTSKTLSYRKWSCIKLLLTRIEQYKKTICTENQLVTLKNQRAIFETVVDIFGKVKEKLIDINGSQKGDSILSFIHRLAQHILKERDTLSDQEIDDYKNEIRRGSDYIVFLNIKKAIKVAGKSEDASKQIAALEEVLKEPVRYEEARACRVKQELDSLKNFTKLDGLDINEEERLEIVRAMGLSKGHWFKCPNNHIYAIGECGGAMERGKCPDCSEVIGGDHHRLTDGNTLASDMDGASYAAYSEEANNMANFDLHDLE